MLPTAIAKAVAGAINQDDAARGGKRIAEGEALVLQVAARAVQQHDRRIVGVT